MPSHSNLANFLRVNFWVPRILFSKPHVHFVAVVFVKRSSSSSINLQFPALGCAQPLKMFFPRRKTQLTFSNRRKKNFFLKCSAKHEVECKKLISKWIFSDGKLIKKDYFVGRSEYFPTDSYAKNLKEIKYRRLLLLWRTLRDSWRVMFKAASKWLEISCFSVNLSSLRHQIMRRIFRIDNFMHKIHLKPCEGNLISVLFHPVKSSNYNSLQKKSHSEAKRDAIKTFFNGSFSSPETSLKILMEKFHIEIPPNSNSC